MDFDGERFTPENVREIWYEHMHRYAFAARLVKGLDVLDAACGEGYGSAILARAAASVAAVDISAEAIAHAGGRYQGSGIDFQQADCCALPFEDDRFDCVVSFETIEHLEDQAGMLAEFRRVLKPSGFLLISSPDKAVYSDAQEFHNPHHVRELYAEEFCELLGAEFPACRLFGQKLMFHSAIWPFAEAGTVGDEAGGRRLLACLQQGDGQSTSDIERPAHAAMYLLALCAAEESHIPALAHAIWLFDDAQESVYRHYQHEIRKNMQAGAILAERDAALAEAYEALETARTGKSRGTTWLQRLGLSRRDRD